jgi:hypothetical protein
MSECFAPFPRLIVCLFIYFLIDYKSFKPWGVTLKILIAAIFHLPQLPANP